MKKTILFCLLFLVFIVSNGNAERTRPVAVSPGSESGMVVVGQSCPTFSWSAVQWTEAYRVVVFQAVGDEVLSYEEMDALGYPVISKEIRGPALSWTPSEEERLSNGEVYVWYVQAVDGSEVGVWSEGRMFQVEVAVRLVGVEERLRESLKEYGMREEDIDRVFNDVTSGVKEVDVQGDSLMPPGRFRIKGTEDTYNTFYGNLAGANTTGLRNSFFGSFAGYNNTTAAYNTFIGFKSGYNNSGLYNTFIGHNAGYYNSAHSNVFIGLQAGYSNTSGYYNVFIGNSAGYKNKWGALNAILGYKAGYSSTNGWYNVFLGYSAGYNSTVGQFNTFIGSSAGYSNDWGGDNVYIGHKAGYSNRGNSNVFIGLQAGNNTANGNGNVFLGYRAGYYETTSNEATPRAKARGFGPLA